MVGDDAARAARRARSRATRSAGSTSASSASSRRSSGSCCSSSSSPASWPTGPGGSATAGPCSRRSASRRSRCCSSSSSPTSAPTLVYAVALFAVLFVAGTRWAHLAALGLGTLAVILAVLWLLPSAGVHVLKPYQEQRLTHFTHPDQDPSGATYNVAQSINAVGSGGLRGRGIAGATQTSLHFLPEHATDFAFASLAEQRGFVGVSILLLLYLLVVWRGLKIVAGRARRVLGDRRGRDRGRVPVPDLRQRRHDDRDRPGDRNPASVRERRRLGDDRQPARDRRAARRFTSAARPADAYFARTRGSP